MEEYKHKLREIDSAVAEADAPVPLTFAGLVFGTFVFVLICVCKGPYI